MVADIDIYRSAKLLIQQHGTAAWLEAATRFRELKAQGDLEGAVVWKRIAAAIAELDDMKGADTLH